MANTKTARKTTASKRKESGKSGTAFLVVPVSATIKRGPARKSGKKVDPGKMSRDRDPFFG